MLNKKNKFKKTLNKAKHAAFSLAEVLVVITVIGIVASITIPALLNNTQLTEYKSAWKKTYSDINEATQRIMMDNGGSFNGLCGVGNNWNDLDNCLAHEYIKYLNVAKACDDNTSETNTCGSISKGKELNNTAMNYGLNTYGSGIQLTSGAFISIEWWPVNGANKPWGIYCSDNGPNEKNVCGYMMVDTNGGRGPNQLGKDLYFVDILEKGIKPYGTQGSTIDTQKISGHLGCDLTIDPAARGYSCAIDYLNSN